MNSATRNGLHYLTAFGAVLVGAFLIAGAYGHLKAVLPLIDGDTNSGRNSFALLLPGLLLAFAGVLNIALCKRLWDGKAAALAIAIVSNALALIYLVYLLWKGVPGHPVATFTGVVASYLVLLAAVRFGLVWPARE